MFSSTMSILICVAAIWLTQRLLTIHQVMQFRKQLTQLRAHGQVCVGQARKVGRRVYVALAFDDRKKVTSALVFRGVTVFSRGRDQPALIGWGAKDLAAGRAPDGLPALVAQATRNSGELFVAGRKAPVTSLAPF